MRYFLLLVLSALCLRAELEFAGYFATTREAQFKLTEREAQRTSGWLRLGQSFAGYTLTGFDRARETITLHRAGETLTLPLRLAKVKEGKTTINGSVQLFGEQIDGVQAALFIDEESAFPLKDGVVLRITPQRRPDGSIVYRSAFDLRKPDGSIEQRATPDVIARPGTSFGVRMGEVGFEFKP
jgi:hypothetical protein